MERAQVDHVVVVVSSLAETTKRFAAAGFTVTPGGRHDAIPTENALIAFADGTYLELLAARDAATRDELRALRASPGWERHLKGVSAVARRFLPALSGADGVADWVLRGERLERPAAALRTLGVKASGPVAMARERPDGLRLAWELLLPEPRLHPFWIADRTSRGQRVPGGAATEHANGATGITAVGVRTPSVPTAALELGESLGTVPRLIDGVTTLDLAAARIEVVEGEPAGACRVTLAGCAGLPSALVELGVTPGS
jgi:hypothetical protein